MTQSSQFSPLDTEITQFRCCRARALSSRLMGYWMQTVHPSKLFPREERGPNSSTKRWKRVITEINFGQIDAATDITSTRSSAAL